MNNKLVNILGIDFFNTSFKEMVNILSDKIRTKEKTFVVTANPEIVMHAYENEGYKRILQTADYIVPDGNGILLAGKILGKPIKERVTGYDLTVELLQLANQNQWKVYLLGGKEEINEKAANNICKKYPNLNLVGRHHGYFKWEDTKLRDEIRGLTPDIVLVALGFPRQEEWIAENSPAFSKGIFIGVGGSIDVLSGEVKRAPEIWQKLKLEWFYRLLKNPSRWRRMLALPLFVIEVLKRKQYSHSRG